MSKPVPKKRVVRERPSRKALPREKPLQSKFVVNEVRGSKIIRSEELDLETILDEYATPVSEQDVRDLKDGGAVFVDELFNKGVLSPSYVEHIEPLVGGTYEPGQVRYSPSGELLRRYFQEHKLTGFIIELYDQWIRVDLQNSLMHHYVQVHTLSDSLLAKDRKRHRNSTYYLAWSDVVPTPPYDSEGNPVFPNDCRLKRESYMLSLTSTMYLLRDSPRIAGNESNVLWKSSGVHIGTVPLMLGSHYDHLVLEKLSPEQLELVGEDPRDPRAYFIMEGNEKSIRNLQSPGLSRILVYDKPMGSLENLCCRLIVPYEAGTKNTELKVRTKVPGGLPGEIVLAVPDTYAPKKPRKTGKKAKEEGEGEGSAVNKETKENARPIPIPINLFQAFRMLGVEDVNEIIRRICIFIPEEYRYCLTKIQPTIAGYKADEGVQTARGKNVSFIHTLAEAIGVTSEPGGPGEQRVHEVIEDIKKGVLFPSIRSPDFKIHMLALMSAKLLQVMAGCIPPDDRDSLSLNMVKGASVLMSNLYNSCWKLSIRPVLQERVGEKVVTGNETNLESLKTLVGDLSVNITQSFIESFRAKWRVKNANTQGTLNDTIILSPSPLAARYSEVTRIAIKMSNNNKLPEPKQVQSSQVFYKDMFKTPDGGITTGTITYFATNSRATREASWTVVMNRLAEFKLIKLVPPGAALSYRQRFWEAEEVPNEEEEKLQESFDDQFFYHNDPAEGMVNPLLIGGLLRGWCNAARTRAKLVELRRKDQLGGPYISIIGVPGLFQAEQVKIQVGLRHLQISVDANRYTCPFLIIDPQTHRLLIDVLDRNGQRIPEGGPPVATMRAAPFSEMLTRGCVEYLDAAELEHECQVAPSFERLVQTNEERHDLKIRQAYFERLIAEGEALVDPSPEDKKELAENRKQLGLVQKARNFLEREYNFTHLAIDPAVVLGFSSGLVHFLNHAPPARISTVVSQIDQAITPSRTYATRYDANHAIMGIPERPIARTELSAVSEISQGKSLIVAFVNGGPLIEDGLAVNQRAIDAQKLSTLKLFTYEAILEAGHGGNYVDTLGPLSTHRRRKEYLKIDSHGLPKVGEFYKSGDVIIGVTREHTKGSNPNRYTDVSVKVRDYEEGIVYKPYHVFQSANGRLLVQVQLLSLRNLKLGDKIEGSQGQKGTISKIIPIGQAPVIYGTNVEPDILFDACNVVGRTTPSFILEALTGKIAAITGEVGNTTALRQFNEDDIARLLVENGFDRMGYHTLQNGRNGRLYNARIFIAPVEFRVNSHQVENSEQGRGNVGPMVQATGQPLKGRGKGGALALGWGEIAAILSFGSAETAASLFGKSSDLIEIRICVKCGLPAEWIPAMKESQRRGHYGCRICESKTTRVLIPGTLAFLFAKTAVAGFKHSFTNQVPLSTEEFRERVLRRIQEKYNEEQARMSTRRIKVRRRGAEESEEETSGEGTPEGTSEEEEPERRRRARR